MDQTRYVAYLRVSTQRQGLSGLGIEAQRQAIANFVRLSGSDLVAEYVEAESGADDGREQLAEALDLCRRTRSTLLVAKLDRLARSVRFVSATLDSGVPIVAADNPHASRLVLHMLAAVAEFEREQISHRTKAALQAARSRGIKLGLNGRRLAEQHKQSATDFAESLRPMVVAARAAGATTPSRLAQELNAQGVRSRAGGKWHASNVSRVLVRLGLSGPDDLNARNGWAPNIL